MTDVWDEMRTQKQQGKWQRWENVGDTLAGTIKAKVVGYDMNGNSCPELVIETDDGDERTVTASQAQLKNKLIETNPAVGDYVTITYKGTEKRDGGRSLKTFSVTVNE